MRGFGKGYIREAISRHSESIGDKKGSIRNCFYITNNSFNNSYMLYSS